MGSKKEILSLLNSRKKEKEKRQFLKMFSFFVQLSNVDSESLKPSLHCIRIAIKVSLDHLDHVTCPETCSCF